jgi:hypothetical protein
MSASHFWQRSNGVRVMKLGPAPIVRGVSLGSLTSANLAGRHLYRFSTEQNQLDPTRLISRVFLPYPEIISNSIRASSRGEKGEFIAGAI